MARRKPLSSFENWYIRSSREICHSGEMASKEKSRKAISWRLNQALISPEASRLPEKRGAVDPSSPPMVVNVPLQAWVTARDSFGPFMCPPCVPALA